MAEPELEAMSQILTLMEGLDHGAQSRVVKWLGERLGLHSVSGAGPLPNGRLGGVLNERQQSGEGEFRDFADLFDAARPKTDIDKALVAGYWVQFGKSNADFASQSINDELKQLGHPVGNITRALGALIKARPSLVQQLRKDGGSRQARKTYRLTSAGQKKVDQMGAGRKGDE